MRLLLQFKGKTTEVHADSADTVIAAAHDALALPSDEWRLKIVAKGKQLQPGASLPALAEGAKLMVMASSITAVERGLTSRSDPTVRGFAAEDEAASRRAADTAGGADEVSVWCTSQDAEHKFCRFEPCTWQSFGTRPSSTTPHAFEARKLLLRLATDPAVVGIMRERRYRVGTLAEMDPIDDRLAEKMEGGGKRLLGYNTNHGMSIHVRLRTMDLRGFEAYPSLVDTLLHELAHNEVGPHNDLFWHLFAQLKADYLRHHARLAQSGALFSGASPLQLAGVAEQALLPEAAGSSAPGSLTRRPAPAGV
ncbi:hypothetical protein EMIHUDRAFT_373278 [Emiliania huxleyi CCMP1516]|uniref:WLM domain-containing protein n=2 Tax=Emiliania huxleyi TaxID=2903 RepID=A0A0D3JXC7_EMIH1|nr:hypothetical protein EMIHUDRAFT_366332 [Emiliania huxleyi CCMP1516]XP_005788538.1 hypothetical protein EMIHUDRAFT_373278 [Emiliania huxleyi CCMP1516]EOD28162.1 hypothetical protein EMIHUDRAFT_366332 [Emiliania huxleyi CCMP1516]EOD36109.1 hypothetical protein EMIHUDRAFT_373278 [Emiliania huxleyi CCMP1516]|eukprot:XP_005780591.1 hypothetical protein EMIHUDRAFT_366332 [Emiliania huxleyi CCMP1516]